MATVTKSGSTKKPWVVRYMDPDGAQHQKAFARKTGPKGADAFKAKYEHDIRAGIFIDPKVSGERFERVATRWLARHPGSPRTLEAYEIALRRHILPVFGSKSLVAVANDREGVEAFLRETLPAKGLRAATVRTCFMVINAIVGDAVKSGRLSSSRLSGIKLPEASQRADIVWTSPAQIKAMAEAMPGNYGFSIYLMRGCGLRLGEALGVRTEDFGRFGDGRLRVQRQLVPNGSGYAPLKHRGEDDYRDVPTPAYVVVDAYPDDWHSFEPVSHRNYRRWFNSARDAAGLPTELTPHMLRHQFASAALAGGVPITDVSKWLGHRSIQVTYGIYGHLVPESWERARRVLEEDWRSAA